MGRPQASSATVPYNSKNKSVSGYVKPVANIQVPAYIKCCGCKNVKNTQAFSEKRLDDLRVEIAKKKGAFNAQTQAFIPCMDCSPKQVVELFCVGCDKWKGKKAFSNAQCRNPDKARCWPCMDDLQNMQPGGGSSSDSNSNTGSDDDSDDSQGGTTIAGTFSGMSLTNGESSATGGVALASTASVTSSTAVTTTTTTASSYKGATLPPHLRKGPASVTSGNANFPKVVNAGKTKFRSDAARRVREEDAKEEEDDIEVASSDTESD